MYVRMAAIARLEGSREKNLPSECLQSESVRVSTIEQPGIFTNPPSTMDRSPQDLILLFHFFKQ